MNTEKSKNTAAHQGTASFLMFWTAGHTAAWLVTIVLYASVFSSLLRNELAEALFLAFVPGTLITLLQIGLVERGLKKSMRGWIPVSLVGLLASALTYYAYLTATTASEENVYLIVMSLLVPVALVQSFWLWHRVKNAWLWALAAVIGALLFVMPMAMNQSSEGMAYLAVGLAGLLQGVVSGSIMRHLWQHPREKSKLSPIVEAESTAGEDAARLERLRDTIQIDDPSEAAPQSMAKRIRS